jgi:hypothetical protein
MNRCPECGERLRGGVCRQHPESGRRARRRIPWLPLVIVGWVVAPIVGVIILSVNFYSKPVVRNPRSARWMISQAEVPKGHTILVRQAVSAGGEFESSLPADALVSIGTSGPHRPLRLELFSADRSAEPVLTLPVPERLLFRWEGPLGAGRYRARLSGEAGTPVDVLVSYAPAGK